MAAGLPGADPDDHVALNVCLYGQSDRRWTMTERGRGWAARTASEFVIGPSRVVWRGDALEFEIDEIAVPLPRRVLGRVRVWPQALTRFAAYLDAAGRHRWGPIAPVARVEVDFQQPDLRWSGHAYLDSNDGDEPIDRPFQEWDWARAPLADRSTAVIYDVRPKDGADRVIARRFAPDGRAEPFEAPPRQRLPGTAWGIPRTMRSEPEAPPSRVRETLENTPFYVRSVIDAAWCGQPVTAVHETLVLPRVVSTPVRLMLPFRMPRRS